MQPSVVFSILIADESGMLRDGLGWVLRTDPLFQVIALAADGRYAMEVIETRRPDIALLDTQLGGFSPLEIVRRVRERQMRTRVMMMSAVRDRRAMVEALRAGARGFVLKAGSCRQVVEGIEQMLTGGVYLPPELSAEELFVRQRKAEPADPIDTLSAREYEVFTMLVSGVRAKDIAARLGLSPKTVDTYRASMMRKLDIHDLAGLVRFSIRRETSGIPIPPVERTEREAEPSLA